MSSRSPDSANASSRTATAAHEVTFAEAFGVWARVAAQSFGGPAGQIAVMHRIIVEEKRWIGEARFLHALSYCTLLPGPEAQQLAVYIGWLMHRTLGGLMAGLLFVLPGFLSILALSYIYVIFGDVSIVEGLFFGLKAAVLAIVVQAVFRISGRALRNKVMIGIAAAAFIAIFLFKLPFPLIVTGAAIVGFVGGQSGADAFRTGGGHKSGAGPMVADADSRLGEVTPPHARPDLAWSLRISVVLLLLWWVPVAGLSLLPGTEAVFAQIALFFSKMAMVTFGGAYAALSYVAQQAVEHYHWMTPGEMLDGLAMAETTPGPLIQVVQFVGFMAAYRNPGSLSPLTAATLAAILTTWVTYAPCFLWIFLGAPFMEKLRSNAALAAALSCITAAIVGVILNLAIWFALHTLFAVMHTVTFGPLVLDIPLLSSVAMPSLLLSLVAAVAIFRFNMSSITTLLACAVIGMIWRTFAWHDSV